jgi:hypothetical protein
MLTPWLLFVGFCLREVNNLLLFINE